MPYIKPEVIEEIKRLLAEGNLSRRKIAEATGVSRTSVWTVASGKYRAYSPKNSDKLFVGPVRRCLGCGCMVMIPCRVCRIRELAACSPKRGHVLVQGELPELDLAEEDRVRYEQVRYQRILSSGVPGEEDGGNLGQS